MIVSLGVGSLIFLPGTARASSNAGGQVLPPDQVTQLTTPGTTLTDPVDGRLRGPDFQAEVTGVAWPAYAGVTPNRYTATPGRRLVVFFLTMSQPADDVGSASAGDVTATAAVTPDANQPSDPLDLSSIDLQIGYAAGDAVGTASGAFVVSVPATSRDAALTVSEGSFSQSFNLWTLERSQPFPAVLYRSPTAQVVSALPTAGATITVTNPADANIGPANISVTSAQLTAFAPDGASSPLPSADDAYLVVKFQSLFQALTNGNDPYIHFAGIEPLVGSALTFSTPGLVPVAATATDRVDPSEQYAGSLDDGLLDATYAFIVPASTTSGTVSIAASTITGVEYDGFSEGQPVPLQIGGPTTLSLSFPSPLEPSQPQPTPRWVTAPLPVTSPGRGTTTSTSTGFLAWLLIVILLVLVAVGSLIYRVRRRGATLPLRDRPPPYRPLRPPVLTAPDVPLALPPGPLSSELLVATEPIPSQQPDEPVAPVAGPGAGSATATNVVSKDSSSAGALNRPIEVLILGPVQISGWATPPRRRIVPALLCYFLLHSDRPTTTEQLHGALWPIGPDRKEPSRATLHTYVSELRTAVGPGVLPDAGTVGGYILVGGVTDDWSTFTSLVGEAEVVGPVAAADLRAQALSLVRGPPFAGVSPGMFDWVSTEHYLAVIEVAITDCSHALSSWHLQNGDHLAASRAVEIGLLGVPDSYLLHADLIRTAAATGDPAGLRRARKRTRHTLGDVEADRLFEDLG
jgi:hypothetical protein